MQFFGLLIPIIIGYFLDEMATGVIIGSLFWLVAWSIAKQRQEERLAESATAGDRMQKLEQEIELLKRRLSVLEHEAVRDEAKVGQGLEARAVSDVQTASEPLQVRVEPEAEAAPVKQKIEEAFAPSFSIPINPVSAKAAASSEPVVESEVIEAVAPVVAEQEELPKEEAVVASMPSESEEAPSRQFVIHKAQSEGGEYKFSDNPIVAWFLRGNPLLKTGIVVLFLGLAFLLRYASERVHVPVELRYLTVAGAGLAAVVGGWKLQSRKREYGLVLQGFGVAVMYLTALAALKLHPLLPVSVVFGLMVAMVVLMAWLAVRQNAQIMAQVALIGGMAAPLLTSDGSGNYLVLFSYLALLNAGVAAIAWFKAWRPLNLTGFAATFAIATLWGMRSYTPQHFATTEPFLIYHWLLYTFIAYLFARRKLTENSEDSVTPIADNATLEEIGNSIYTHGLRVHVLDHTLLFGTMAAAFGLQYRMVEHWPSADALSALGFAAVYGLAALLLKRQQGLYILRQAFFALAVLFLTIAVPLYFEPSNTVILWSAESALVYFFGLRQQRPHIRLGALIVYLLAALIQLGNYQGFGTDTVLEGQWFTTVVVLLGGAAIYLLWYFSRREGSAQWEKSVQTAVLSTALLYISILPLLFLADQGSIVALSALAAAWAFCRRKHEPNVFITFALGNVLFALLLQAGIIYESQGFLSHLYLIAATPLLFAAAYALQYPRVPVATEKPEGNEVYFAQVSGWIILLTALATGSYALYMQWTGEETLFTQLWLWPIFAGLLLFAKRLKWEELLQTNLAFLPLFGLHFLSYHTEHAVTAAAALPLAAATVLNFIILNNYPRHDLIWLHKLNITILGVLWTLWTALYVGGLLSGVWSQLSWLVVPLAMWIVFHTQRQREFFRRHQAIYQHFAMPLCALAAACWMLWTNFSTPFQPSPLPYIPVLNPVELASAGMLWFALKSLPEALPPELRRTTATTVSALAFMLISAGVMRVWHFYDGITWRLDIMLQSFGLQASLSVVWAVTAIILMVLGNRRKQRSYWMTGATLMGIVVVKLFLIELSNSGGIARIVSFIIVGLLLLLVGWFAPVPPKAENDGESKA